MFQQTKAQRITVQANHRYIAEITTSWQRSLRGSCVGVRAMDLLAALSVSQLVDWLVSCSVTIFTYTLKPPG